MSLQQLVAESTNQDCDMSDHPEHKVGPDLPPELLYIIFGRCTLSDLASAARVCREWGEEASTILWGRASVSFRNLLALLGTLVAVEGPGDNVPDILKVYSTATSFEAIDIEAKHKFLRRAAAVTKIKIDVNLAQDTILSIHQITGGAVLFPRLSAFELLTWSDFLTLPLLLLVRSSSIKHLALLRNGSPELFQSKELRDQGASLLWEALSKAAPCIQSIMALGRESIRFPPRGPRFAELRIVRISSPLIQLSTFQSLAQVPQLSDLRVYLERYDRVPWRNSPLAVVFPNLKEFAIQDVFGFSRIVEDLRLPELNILRLSTFYLPSQHLHILAERSPSVRVLQLSLEEPMDLTTLNLSGRFHDLEVLRMESLGNFSLSGADVISFVQGLPRLKELMMISYQRPHETALGCDSPFNVATLSSIATHCHQLRTLFVPMCLTIASTSSPATTFTNLTSIGFAAVCGSRDDIPGFVKVVAEMLAQPEGVTVIRPETRTSRSAGRPKPFVSELEDTLQAAVNRDGNGPFDFFGNALDEYEGGIDKNARLSAS